MSAPWATVAGGVEATVRRKIALFGTGATLYGIGPHLELIGKETAVLPQADLAGGTATLDGASLLRSFDPSSPLVPSHVTGVIQGSGLPASLDLAVAVNGRIEALTQTFRVGGSVRFSAFVPETSFRAGANDLEVFAIAADRRTVQLEPIHSAASLDDYVLDDKHRLIRGTSGKDARLVPGALQGLPTLSGSTSTSPAGTASGESGSWSNCLAGSSRAKACGSSPSGAPPPRRSPTPKASLGASAPQQRSVEPPGYACHR